MTLSDSSYDFIIVGGGSAGCVLANRLSNDPANKVLLVEAGDHDNSAKIRTPLGTVLLYMSEKYNWRFWTQKEEKLNRRNVFCPQGKTLGGGSSINALIYSRGNAWDYDQWESFGNRGWGYSDLLRHFKLCESNLDIDDEYHGQDGGLSVRNIENPHPHAERLVMAALQAGYSYNSDFNGETQAGVGMYQVTMKGRQRESAATAFLHPVKHRPNLEIVVKSQTLKINFSGSKAIGITYKVAGKVKEVSARKEVIVSAGTFNTPKLLMLSGIGPKQELDKHGIEVVKDLPGVGENLQEHADIVISTKSKISDTVSVDFSGVFKMAYEFYRHITNKAGLFSKPIVESGGFIYSTPQKEVPDIQLQSTCSLFNDHGLDYKVIREHGYSLHITLLRPKSRGKVKLRSSCHDEEPLINLNLLDHNDDVNDLINGFKIGRKILSQDAYQRHREKELFPGEHVQTDEEIEQMLRERVCHIYHPVGTCKMGTDELAVVDDQLRVYGVENLRVIDASIMPTITSGNTNAPTMAIASKGAEMILEHYQYS